MYMKICIKCKLPKDESEFAFRNKETGLTHSICKECQRKYAQAHYKRNPKYYVDKAKRLRGRCVDLIREKMLRYLEGKKCQTCSEDDPVVLEFHHRHPEEKEYSVSFISRKSWKRTLKEIEKCDIMCANCHRKKTAQERGWYRFLKTA